VKASSFFSICFIVVLFDQITKIIIKAFRPHLFLINYIENTGAAFGLFRGNNFFLTIISVVVVLVILLQVKNIIKDRAAWSYALVLGGLLGNLIDRLAYGFVVDFIDLQFWPVFNIADSALTLGVLGIIAYSFIKLA